MQYIDKNICSNGIFWDAPKLTNISDLRQGRETKEYIMHKLSDKYIKRWSWKESGREKIQIPVKKNKKKELIPYNQTEETQKTISHKRKLILVLITSWLCLSLKGDKNYQAAENKKQQVHLMESPSK